MYVFTLLFGTNCLNYGFSVMLLSLTGQYLQTHFKINYENNF